MLRYYIWTIIVCIATISLLNYFLLPLGQITLIYAFLFTTFTTICVIILDGIIAFIIHKLPNKIFNPFKKIFRVPIKERTFYEKIKIRKWKDKVPEMGKYLCNFDKRKITENQEKYIFKFLEETCYAEWVHYGMAFIGFLLLFILPSKFTLSIVLPVVLVNFFLNLPPIFIQRYNRPKLFIFYQRISSKK